MPTSVKGRNGFKSYQASLSTTMLWKTEKRCYKMNLRGELNTEALGRRIAEFQVDRGFTQERLAESLGVETSTIGRWTRGERTPTLHNFCRLANVLGISMDELIDGRSDKSPAPTWISYHDKPIISLVRQPRNREEMMGLRTTEMIFQGCGLAEVMNQLDIPEQDVVRRLVSQIASNMLFVETERIPLDEGLAKRLQCAFDLKTCIVTDVKDIDFSMLELVVLGALGARVISDMARSSGVRLHVGFAGGFSCAQVIMSLTQAKTLPKVDVMPIAVQSPEHVVANDANTLVGMSGFLTDGTNLNAHGLPFISNAQLKQDCRNPLYESTRQALARAKKVDVAFLSLGGD
jgi:transcriptional regulator with XRE-family HTH domain